MRKRIVILGSTGSIGQQALDVVRAHPDHFEIVGLAARVNAVALAAQAAEFTPRVVCLTQADPALLSSSAVPVGPRSLTAARPRVLTSEAGLADLATLPEADLVLIATPGTVGRPAALAALAAGKDVALANKESLVTAGPLLKAAAARSGASILPVDSEHSAIWQCLAGEEHNTVRRLILTASGGPFRTTRPAGMATITPAQALAHPTWQMGPKVTVDSATLMNKGLEASEAHWLFDVPFDRIEIVIHAESIVHSLVEFVDGSVKAQLSSPDMRLPIQYALAYPTRLPAPNGYTPPRPFDLAAIGALHFEEPDYARFPCLPLAIEAGMRGGTAPAVLAAADEVAVEAFLREEIGFPDIAQVVAATLAAHLAEPIESLAHLEAVESWARACAADEVRRLSRRPRLPHAGTAAAPVRAGLKPASTGMAAAPNSLLEC